MKKIKLLIFFLLISYVHGYAQNVGLKQGKTVTINGTELFVKVIGNGEPIIIVHGGPVLDHSYLLPHLEQLSENYKLVFFDQRLSGRSSAEADTADIKLSTFIKDIQALQAYLGFEKIHILGHSWGGLLAMKYAISHPLNIYSLILVSSMPPSSELWRKEELILAESKTKEDSLARQKIMQTEAFRKNSPKAIEKLLELSFRNQFYNRVNAESLDLYVPDDYMTRSRLFGHLMGELSDYNLLKDLKKMTSPALILYGSAEPANKISGPMLHKHIPNSEYIIINKSGHFPFIEQTAKFTRYIQEFLEDIPQINRE